MEEDEGEGFGQKPRSLILIKKHKEHQRPTSNLYQSGAPNPHDIKTPRRLSVSSSEAGRGARVTPGLEDFKVLKVNGKVELSSPNVSDWPPLNKLSTERKNNRR